MKYTFYTSMFLLLFWSCSSDLFTKDIELSTDHFEPQLNINANYLIGDTIFTILVSETLHPTEKNYFYEEKIEYIFDENGNVIDSFFYMDQSRNIPKIDYSYELLDDLGNIILANACTQCNILSEKISPDLIKPNIEYTLIVRNEKYGEAKAKASGNDAFDFKVIDFSQKTDETQRVEIELFDNNPDDDNYIFYYQYVNDNKNLNYFFNDNFRLYAEDNPLFKDIYWVEADQGLPDDFFSKNSYQFTLKSNFYFSYDEEKPTKAKVYVRRLSEDFFQFLRSKEKVLLAEDNPFAEPVSLHLNFENAIGIFSIDVAKSVSVNIED